MRLKLNLSLVQASAEIFSPLFGPEVCTWNNFTGLVSFCSDTANQFVIKRGLVKRRQVNFDVIERLSVDAQRGCMNLARR